MRKKRAQVYLSRDVAEYIDSLVLQRKDDHAMISTFSGIASELIALGSGLTHEQDT